MIKEITADLRSINPAKPGIVMTTIDGAGNDCHTKGDINACFKVNNKNITVKDNLIKTITTAKGQYQLGSIITSPVGSNCYFLSVNAIADGQLNSQIWVNTIKTIIGHAENAKLPLFIDMSCIKNNPDTLKILNAVTDLGQNTWINVYMINQEGLD